jgi:hypothetical protein
MTTLADSISTPKPLLQKENMPELSPRRQLANEIVKKNYAQRRKKLRLMAFWASDSVHGFGFLVVCQKISPCLL